MYTAFQDFLALSTFKGSMVFYFIDKIAALALRVWKRLGIIDLPI